MKIKPGPKGPHKHPLLKKQPVTIKLSQYVKNVLNQQANKSVAVEDALVKMLKIKKPVNI